MKATFSGKVLKVAVNAGLGCPNKGGCTYCNNASFSPGYTRGDIAAQMEKGKAFFEGKGVPCGYLAYFQSFTGTYGPVDRLIGLYEEALACPGVLGLVIATRPDCLPEELLDYFRHRFGADAPEGHPYLLVEIGVESTEDRTLEKIGRGHTWDCARDAILRLDKDGINVGVHLIIGLPGEDDDDFIRHADRISELPVKTLKLHQLQIVKGTAMAEEYRGHPERFQLLTPVRYAQIILRMLDHIRPDIALDRFVSEAPKGMVIAPSWGLKPVEFAGLLSEMDAQRCYDVLLFGSMGDISDIAAGSLRSHGLTVVSVPFPQNTCHDVSGYERSLLKAVRRYHPGMVIPVGNMQTASRLVDKMPPGVIMATGMYEHIRLLDSKIEAYRLAKELGIPQPRTFDSPDDMDISVDSVVLKRDKSFGGSGVHRPRSRVSLEHLMQHEPGGLFLIEEYIGGEDYSVDCVTDGREFRFSCYRCTSNRGCGPSRTRECVDFPELGKYARMILEHLGFKGVCGMDFRVDSSGRAFFLECNPRLCGGLKTQMESGFDIPWMLYSMFSRANRQV